MGNSLNWQEEYVRKHCAARNRDVVAVYKDDKSGKTFRNRDEFHNLMKFCKAHKSEIDYVYVYRWDRYSRNLKEALINLDYFDKLGIEVNSVEQNVDFHAAEWITLLSLYISAAQTEDVKISRRTKECIHQARENGHCVCRAPRGYLNRQHDDEHKYVVIDESVAPHIRAIFAEVAEGVMTPTAIARKFARKGFAIHKNSMMKMLRNPFYKGYIFVPTYNDTKITIPEHLVRGLHEAMIDEETFDRVQDVIDGSRKHTPKATRVLHPDLFLRKYVVCPVCGAPLTGSGCTGNGGKYYYYNCSRDGKHFRISAPKANELFRKYVATLVPNDGILELYSMVLNDIKNADHKKITAEIKKVQDELGKCNERLRNISVKYADNEIGKEDYENLTRQIKELLQRTTDRKALLEKALQTDIEPKLKYSMYLISNLAQYIDDSPVEAKCKLIGSMFPTKLQFDGKLFRTDTYNSVLDLIYRQTNELRGQNKRDFSKNIEKSPQVPPQGLEPWTPTLRVSCSTN